MEVICLSFHILGVGTLHNIEGRESEPDLIGILSSFKYTLDSSTDSCIPKTERRHKKKEKEKKKKTITQTRALKTQLNFLSQSVHPERKKCILIGQSSYC